MEKSMLQEIKDGEDVTDINFCVCSPYRWPIYDCDSLADGLLNIGENLKTSS